LKFSYCRTTTRNYDNIIESRHRSCSREDFATSIIDATERENDELPRTGRGEIQVSAQDCLTPVGSIAAAFSSLAMACS